MNALLIPLRRAGGVNIRWYILFAFSRGQRGRRRRRRRRGWGISLMEKAFCIPASFLRLTVFGMDGLRSQACNTSTSTDDMKILWPCMLKPLTLARAVGTARLIIYRLSLTCTLEFVITMTLDYDWNEKLAFFCKQQTLSFLACLVEQMIKAGFFNVSAKRSVRTIVLVHRFMRVRVNN